MGPGLVLLAALSSVGTSEGEPPAPAPAIGGASPSRGWVGLQDRSVWGLAAKNATQDYGADVLAGLWLLHEQLQPIVDIGWSRVFGQNNGASIDTFRAGGKVGGGYSLAGGSLWLGGTVGVVVQTGWLHITGTSLAWAASPSVSGLLQARFARRLLVGAEVGVEHSIPALQWGAYSVFNGFRLQLGLQLGVILGDAISGS